MKKLLYVSKFSGRPVTLMIVLEVVVGVPTDGLIPIVSVVGVMPRHDHCGSSGDVKNSVCVC